jgi:hypothetical protein
MNENAVKGSKEESPLRRTQEEWFRHKIRDQEKTIVTSANQGKKK